MLQRLQCKQHHNLPHQIAARKGRRKTYPRMPASTIYEKITNRSERTNSLGRGTFETLYLGSSEIEGSITDYQIYIIQNTG